jgi:hypothetical protein
LEESIKSEEGASIDDSKEKNEHLHVALLAVLLLDPVDVPELCRQMKMVKRNIDLEILPDPMEESENKLA